MKKILLIISIILFQIAISQSDCPTSVPVCGNAPISFTPSGPGSILESLGGCLNGEHYSVWYSFTIQTSGTLTMTISPNGQADYDWAIYGPNTTCNNLGTPIRCSYASISSGILTGMNTTATDTTEGASGDGWVQQMNVVAGQTYYMVVDNFSSNSNGFQLTWGGTSTFVSPFGNSSIQTNPFVPPGNNGNVFICVSPTVFDFSTLSAGILNGNTNFQVSYYTSSNNAITNTNPIVGPTTVNTTTTYYYAISYQDPNNPTNPINKCREYGTINFSSGTIAVNNPTIFACNNNNIGIGTFDISTATPLIFSDPTAIIKYYPTMADLAANTNQITNLTNYTTPPKQIFALVTTSQGCTNTATVSLELYPLLPLNEITLTACNNNNAGLGYFDLTTANVYPAMPNATKKYFPTVNDLLAGTNQIQNPNLYLSSQGSVFVEVTGLNGCRNYVPINLAFYPITDVLESTLTECYIPSNPKTAAFNLADAVVSSTVPSLVTYHASQQDAINNSNIIQNPNVYISNETTVFARVYNSEGCWRVANINLKITPPAYSPVLVDKVICLEDRTTLDAGPGFSSYLWSTGATTQVATNISVGEYWVDLESNGCITRQTVKVFSAAKPIIKNIEINNNSVTIFVYGGKEPYQFSIDGINWQTSNTINNLPRGQVIVFVKDAFDCNPVAIEFTVPNLINAITPNDDNVNDVLDYSALIYKKDLEFNIFDRYGNKLFTGNKKNSYTWNGRTSGKRLVTGNYWYTITWKEPNTDLPVKYSGWIVIKNK